MSNLLKYTPITTDDISQLMPIENTCHSHPWTEKTFSSCIGGRYFGEKLAETTEKIIGFYVGEFVVDEATLMDICVDPTEQSKGYGKKLLHHFIEQAKAKGAIKIWLEVRAKNISAQMLYMNAGFIEISRRTGYYPSSKGFGYEDAIVMSLKL
ncbi:ribosomal protein S18-alanine N-acetyltransferase [Colwellia sp. 4_MG-2023]|jgi:ribosomal-protein-alanine N-acetyltransferase|uniref:ribosomal protein S18-alanine N-acetyltransferase n=1 Tax=unclassified Colwellia TaxID=196834 RepID=UPI00209153C9|nr:MULTISPECIES: ribosomal protein S18-alanine N-acetyltransferase [unclassified Colwellia]MDO6488031.1 ribosomal protein S18-alanine N-acetyltransferase [Colwellia sp. 6_MG-2023]MDO6506485.1 ribosomal protein S18-alanine N-acetyltransferase [Colwellia sp. 5_MG-2023]MDO6554972.1 ribosomal protein S18-alanine N-acetyltransferase [Colwellia sp. 4_MG-2023]MDO6651849.1 ribosomal protein S18-alanine N-acetyltransferase [Colwellia sp. 3_MG-2023]MDO6665240.1 ribosomal protein S18-alanine N-acetyltran